MRKLVLCLAMCLALAPPIYGQEVPRAKGVDSLREFKSLLVLEDGRIKPMDTYARNLLLRFSGRRSFDRKPAVHWLARLVFAPEQSLDDKIFLINNPQIAMALNIEPEKKRRYSYSQLEKGVDKLTELAESAKGIESKERTAVDQEILRVFENLHLYIELSSTLRFAYPYPDFRIASRSVRRNLGLDLEKEMYSFLDVAQKANVLKKYVENLKNKPSQKWTREEWEVTNLLKNMMTWGTMFQQLPFHVIPSKRVDEAWHSPWDAIAVEFQDPGIRGEIESLSDMVGAYWSGQQLEFDIAARSFASSIKERAGVDLKRAIQVSPLELFYNSANPFLFAKLFYALAFALFLVSFLSSTNVIHRAALFFVWTGFVAHTLGLIVRIVIMARPPVTNLYETFIFVGFVSAICGLIIERINQKWLGIMVSSICGFVFLLIAAKFAAEGDTMKMLVAVLNSNFWLSTHVISITTGYAGCCVAGVIGHVYIVQRLNKRISKKSLDNTYRFLIGALGFGLTMTFLGTNLGGIWADQSWGRFWGWDPKENGALMIVLWTALIFHAKIARMVGPLGVAAGSALGIIVVMWAWFGVNLLSIGLHSYGFTSGVAYGLIAYVILQVLFLAVVVPIARNREVVK